MFHGLGNFASLLKQVQQMGSKMPGFGEELRAKRVTGSAGGGMVEIELNGLLEVLQCRIDSQLIGQADGELLEDLVSTAVNQAISKGKQLHAESFKNMTGEMNIPNLDGVLEKFLGSQPADQPDDQPDKS